MGVGGDAAEHRAGGVECQGVRGRLAGEQAAGEAVGQGRLADALRPGDQPGVVHPPGADGVQDGRLGVVVAEQNGVGAWVGGRHQVVIARQHWSRERMPP